MNIQILDSWLKEFLDTKAEAKQIADCLSLTSVSVERVTKTENDSLYDIEVTTNRPDLMSVVGLAREAAAILPHFDIPARFHPPVLKKPQQPADEKQTIEIKNDAELVGRILAVVMEVKIGESPDYIKKRLEASGIRSLNNLIDVTNYVMREIGHPTHVFDYDRLTTKKLIIRQSKKGEVIETLDHKKHTLSGGDIIADDGTGNIVDLLGVMGTANSVVTNNTKRILFFLDNNDPTRIRKTSMSLAIRSEAAVLNEKGVDPELAHDALLRGIEQFIKTADGKVVSEIIDIYPKKPKEKKVSVTEEKINEVLGISIPLKTSQEILTKLGFETKADGKTLIAKIPSWRLDDITISEDLIEEIARVYGYHRLPSLLPELIPQTSYHLGKNEFYWENRLKNALKYWGFVEVYTYSMVSADLFEGPTSEAVELSNPLNEDMIYLRKTLVPSLLASMRENKNRQELKIFELANVYVKRKNDLPDEVLTLAGVIKKPNVTFFEGKGIVEQLLSDLGIQNLSFKDSELGGLAADVYIGKTFIGDIEVLDNETLDFELNFEEILNFVSLKKSYTPISKFPSAIEDIRFSYDQNISFATVVDLIKQQTDLVSSVQLLDMYENKKTFRITYHAERNLTAEDLLSARKKIIEAVEKKLKGKVV